MSQRGRKGRVLGVEVVTGGVLLCAGCMYAHIMYVYCVAVCMLVRMYVCTYVCVRMYVCMYKIKLNRKSMSFPTLTQP
jgi:hypothetical protein